ncbi:MAG: acyltransferase [Cyclobacteriaceae bacterium]|nr:acyltransferase [Cyclobacteriaceae bacterium]
MTVNSRLHNLDYLRGLAAASIMFYHFTTWSFGEYDADTLIRRIGIYGVAIFYVLSGLTLYHVYFKKLFITENIISFFKKRVLRIFPLLWLATLATIVLNRESPDATKLVLNLSGLFGLVAWDKYFAVGAWSIGNELVFYLLFPFLIIIARYSKKAFLLLSVLLLGVYTVFAFQILDPSVQLSMQWKNYVNPLNQAFLFVGGFAIGLFFENQRVSVLNGLLLIAAGFALFILYPASGDASQLVTDFARLSFSLSCFLICTGFYKIEFSKTNLITKILEITGKSSYSIYLLHPLVWGATGFILTRVGNHSIVVKQVMAVAITFMVSYFVYEKFEKYFMKLGSRKVSSD